MIGAIALLSFVTCERLAELWLAQRNTKRLMQAGAIEHGRRHYLPLIVLHVIWLIGLWVMAWDLPLNMAWLIAFAVLQILRAWVVLTLGERFTAPPFRTLSRSFPVTDLEEALAEGISSGSPIMPEFEFSPDDSHALVVYLQSIQDPHARPLQSGHLPRPLHAPER